MVDFVFSIADMSLDKKEIGSALRPESTLSWLGFTDVGTPAMHDSSGILSLFPSQSNVWIPFCDTTKNVLILPNSNKNSGSKIFRLVSPTVFS